MGLRAPLGRLWRHPGPIDAYGLGVVPGSAALDPPTGQSPAWPGSPGQAPADLGCHRRLRAGAVRFRRCRPGAARLGGRPEPVASNSVKIDHLDGLLLTIKKRCVDLGESLQYRLGLNDSLAEPAPRCKKNVPALFQSQIHMSVDFM